MGRDEKSWHLSPGDVLSPAGLSQGMCDPGWVLHHSNPAQWLRWRLPRPRNNSMGGSVLFRGYRGMSFVQSLGVVWSLFPFWNTCTCSLCQHCHTFSMGSQSMLPNKTRPFHKTHPSALAEDASKGRSFKYFTGYCVGQNWIYVISKAFLLPLLTSFQVTLPYRCLLLTQGHFQAAEYQWGRDGQASSSYTF